MLLQQIRLEKKLEATSYGNQEDEDSPHVALLLLVQE